MIRISRLVIQQYKLEFAQHLRNKVRDLAEKYCYGCEVDHPSQTHHTCLMWTEQEHFNLYRDEAYKCCNDEIMFIWEKVISLKNIPHEAKFAFLNLLLDRKIVLKEDNVFQMVERMIRLEDRLT